MMIYKKSLSLKGEASFFLIYFYAFVNEFVMYADILYCSMTKK